MNSKNNRRDINVQSNQSSQMSLGNEPKDRSANNTISDQFPGHGQKRIDSLTKSKQIHHSNSKAKNDLVRTNSHSPFQIGRSTASNFKPQVGAINQQNMTHGGSGDGLKNSLHNQSCDKNIPGLQAKQAMVSIGTSGGGMGGIDKTKLQQLKAYQPPKLDYLAQMKYTGGLAQANQNRQNLISADASNLSNNPRLISKQIIEKGLIDNKGSAHDKNRESSINRNDPTRDSMQSRLIERIHTKKLANHHNNFSKKQSSQLQSIQSSQNQPLSHQLINQTTQNVNAENSSMVEQSFGPINNQKIKSSQNLHNLNKSTSKRQIRQMHGGSVEPKPQNNPQNQSIVSESVQVRGGLNNQQHFNEVGNSAHVNNTITSGDHHGKGKSKSPLKLTQNQIDNKSTERVNLQETTSRNIGNTERTKTLKPQNNVGVTMDSSNTGGNTEDISNPSAAVTGSIPHTTDEPTIPSTIVDTLAVKDRSKNGSEPIGGLNKGQLLISKHGQERVNTNHDMNDIQLPNKKSQTVMNSPQFMGKHTTSVPADKTGTGTAVDSIDPEEQEEMLGDLQEGIQADDEDNDQIETERAMGGSGQRKSEFHQIIQGKTLSQTASTRNNNQKVMGSSSQNFNKSSGKRTMSYKQNLASQGNMLYQIKESYEGLNGSNIISSEGGENSLNGANIAISGSNQTLSAHLKDMDPIQQKGQGNNFVSLGSIQGAATIGHMHQHPTMPDKIVTASGAVITRPKSKQQSKKYRQQQAAQNNMSQPTSKFSELRKLQSQNTQSNKALDALKSVNQQEILKQQMMNSFNFVAEEQENEDRGSDGRGSKENNNVTYTDKLSNVDLQDIANNLESQNDNSASMQLMGQHQQINVPSFQYKNKRNNQKKSAIKNYGEIANQLLPHNTFDPILNQQHQLATQSNAAGKVFKLQNKKGSIPLGSHSSQNSYRGTHSNYFQSQANILMQNNGGTTVQSAQQRQQQHLQPQQNNSEGIQNPNMSAEDPRNFQSTQYQQNTQVAYKHAQQQQQQAPQNVYQNGMSSQVSSPTQGQQLISNAIISQKHGFSNKFQDLSQSQDEKNTRSINNVNQSIQNVNPQAYMKKFAVTSSNFYVSPQEQLPQSNQRDQSGSLNARQHFNMNNQIFNNNYKNFQQKNIYQPQSQLSFQNSAHSPESQQDYYKQQVTYKNQQLAANPGSFSQNPRQGQKNLTFQNSRQIKMNNNNPAQSNSMFNNNGRGGQPQQNQMNAYQNNTSYGYRDNQRDNSLNIVKPSGNNLQQVGGPNPGGAGVYNDHQYNNQMIDHLNGQQNQMRMGNHSLGRNTFYVSDYQLQKQSREFNNQSMGRRQKRLYANVGHDVSTAQGSYNMNQEAGSFIKPRAISRQADAHIRIEVHKDQRIIHHLQGEKQENMNLMFYNFNDFSHGNQGQGPNGRRPTAGGPTNEGRRYKLHGQNGPQTQGGMRTQNNFYKPKGLMEPEKPDLNNLDQKVIGVPANSGAQIPAGGNIHDQNINYSGDRIPTRERQYRSAHLNVRRRDITRQQYQQQQQMVAQQQQATKS